MCGQWSRSILDLVHLYQNTVTRTCHSPKLQYLYCFTWCDATIKFRDVLNGSVHEQAVKSGSLYSMTRASQNVFKHSIPRNQALTESDIASVLHSLHWRNSTVIIGESNTGGLKFSSFGRSAPSNLSGTFGNAMPGKRVAAFTVGQLDPFKCIGFNNIVVHCAINRSEVFMCTTKLKSLIL